jgi:hypothetical protein
MAIEKGSSLNTPVLWINTYLQEKLIEDAKLAMPFFPSMPATIDDLTEQWVIVDSERYGYQGVMATWDRLIKMRRSPFPHIKGEQLLYYFYATESGVTEKMVQIQETVLRLMDREDETAEEINSWAKAKGSISINGKDIPPEFYFHNFKIYQLEETRDIIDFGTARTYGGNKIIIDFEYHQMPTLTNPQPNI